MTQLLGSTTPIQYIMQVYWVQGIFVLKRVILLYVYDKVAIMDSSSSPQHFVHCTACLYQ